MRISKYVGMGSKKTKYIYEPQLNITTLAVMCGARVGQASDWVGQAHPGPPVEPGLLQCHLRECS